jgi:plasmid stabilization system protein ParE
MAVVRYNETAVGDKRVAKKIIREYFEKIDSPELADKHIEEFINDLDRKLDILEKHPETYPIRRDYAFGRSGVAIRSFTSHWFTVFYTYDNETDEVSIWFIRSSKSDFSNIFYLI